MSFTRMNDLGWYYFDLSSEGNPSMHVVAWCIYRMEQLRER